MSVRARYRTLRQRGMVLITTLLLLVVVTILALAMFRTVGLENIIAGNVLDKQRAVLAADSAQTDAEQWLLNGGASSNPVDCGLSPPSTSTGIIVCTKPLYQELANGQPATVPWAIGNSSSAGYGYNPGGNDLTVSTSGGINTVYGLPTVYVGQLGWDGNSRNAFDYRVDSWAYGGADATVAVVESTYQIRYTALSGDLP